MKESTHQSILVADDDAAMRFTLQAILEGEGYEVTTTQDGGEASALIQKRKFDLILSDLRMPRMDGIELLKFAKEHSPETSVVILTAYGSIENAVEAMKLGAADYLVKPLESPEQLRWLVSKVLTEKFLHNENWVLKKENEMAFPCAAVITRNPDMHKAIDLCMQVASTDATVLLLGESGTGKELLARCIHAQSQRADKVFVPVNCAALSPSLLESELFGHEKGAFTGATALHMGRFERAHGGSLFLDEIGELDLGLQAKLLRVLEYREFERVGGSRVIKVDVRIVAATNRNLQEAIRQKLFREDLYYRISAFPVKIPPLRERPEDIAPLMKYLIQKLARKLSKPPKPFTQEAIRVLEGYHWPGNVRELENVIERALITCRQDILDAEDFPREISNSSGNRAITLHDIEKETILSALAANNGHHQRTASQLGISLRTLQYRLKEYSLAAVRNEKQASNS